MKNAADRLFVTILILGDLVAITGSIALAFYLRFHTDLLPPPEKVHFWRDYLGFAAIETMVLPGIFTLQRLYQLKRSVSRIDEFYHIFASVSIGTMVSAAITAFIFISFDYSRALVGLAWLFQIIVIWLLRLTQYSVHTRLRRLGIGERRLLIVGTGEMARSIHGRIIASPELGYRTIGFVASRPDGHPEFVESLPVLGNVDDLALIIQQQEVQEVIVADPTLSHRGILQIVAQCEGSRVNVKLFPDLFQIMASEVSIDDLNGLPLLTIRDVALRGWKLTLKRTIDLALSALVLVLLAPLFLATALVIKLTSPDGPVFYVQERVGLDGRPFPLLKFRSMRPDAEEATGPVWARPGDQRTTRIGRILRRFSIDELPQFVNVLLGEMSVVGPRPERPHFVEQFSQVVPRYLERHKEKAGLTGWAQINGLRGQCSIEERTAYDLWYVEHWTLGLDFKIMLRTILTIFRDKHAY